MAMAVARMITSSLLTRFDKENWPTKQAEYSESPKTYLIKRNVAQMATKTMTMTKVGATFALDISVKVTTPPIALCCVSRQAEKPQVVETIKARDEPECAVIFVPCLAPF